MTATLALMGFLALTFLLASRALIASRQDSNAQQRRRRRLKASNCVTGKPLPSGGLMKARSAPPHKARDRFFRLLPVRKT
jgi:hypothetical protein